VRGRCAHSAYPGLVTIDLDENVAAPKLEEAVVQDPKGRCVGGERVGERESHTVVLSRKLTSVRIL
jgi:hypothetical protein